jgi:hypothetical protein
MLDKSMRMLIRDSQVYFKADRQEYVEVTRIRVSDGSLSIAGRYTGPQATEQSTAWYRRLSVSGLQRRVAREVLDVTHRRHILPGTQRYAASHRFNWLPITR